MIELLIGGIILFIVGVGSTIVYDNHKDSIVKWYQDNIYPRNAIIEALKARMNQADRDEDWTKSYVHKNPPPTTNPPSPKINRQPTASEIVDFNNMVKQFDKQVKAQMAQAQKLQSEAAKLTKTKKTISTQEFQKRIEDMKKKK